MQNLCSASLLPSEPFQAGQIARFLGASRSGRTTLALGRTGAPWLRLLVAALVCAFGVACSSDAVGPDRTGPDRGGVGDGTERDPRRPSPVTDVGVPDAGPSSDIDESTPDVSVTDLGGEEVESDAPDVNERPVDPVPDDTRPSGGFTGTVWVPGNGPGQVPAGQEIPVSGALVYLTTTPPPPIPQRTYCASCQTPPARATFSDARGNFSLQPFTPGVYWLVVEKGQFRRQVEVEVIEGATVELDAELTTLPSRNAPSEGMFTPRVAMAVGGSDHLEDIFGKMQLGDVDASGRFVPESSLGVIDIYSNGGNAGTVAMGTLEDLVRDPALLAEYHIVFIPCSGDQHTRALRDQNVLRNIRNYVAGGGNLYVTDWSGEWMDNVFPEQIQLGEGAFGFFGGRVDTPAAAYDRATDTWNTSLFGNADGDSYDTPNAEVVDADMFAWLNGQVGPTPGSASPSTYNASNFRITGNWNYIEAVHNVVVGSDEGGRDVVDEPKVWVIGGSTSRPSPKRPMTVSFEPAGCGRVLFSTYHTTDGVHTGLMPQERVLLYLIMEIGTCRDPKQ